MKTQKRSFARDAKAKSQKKKIAVNDRLPKMNNDASAIDVHPTELWVAIPSDRDTSSVRKFGTFTADLQAMALWLKQCRITTVAMESTGVYWIAPFEVLEQHGFEVKLVPMSATANGCSNFTPSGS